MKTRSVASILRRSFETTSASTSRRGASIEEKEIEMRKLITGTAIVAALSLAPTAAMAQDTQQAQEQNESDDDDGKVGLIGLVGLAGLAGLAGLKRRDRQPDYGRTTANRPSATGANR